MPSGKNGRITKEDALNFLANKSESFETQETTNVTQPKTCLLYTSPSPRD